MRRRDSRMFPYAALLLAFSEDVFESIERVSNRK